MESKLEALLPRFYREMHAQGLFSGDSWRAHLHGLQEFLVFKEDRGGKILDFGCGPSGGLGSVLGERVISYDPHVKQYRENPWSKPFDVFFSCDVFEHLDKHRINHLLKSIARKASLRKICIVLSTRSANKVFSNGVNVHLTVEPAHWWKGLFEARLGADFETVEFMADLLREECIIKMLRR